MPCLCTSVAPMFILMHATVQLSHGAMDLCLIHTHKQAAASENTFQRAGEKGKKTKQTKPS